MKKRKYASGGNTLGTIGSVASGVFGGMQSAFSGNKSPDDKAVYGDMFADPTQRLLGDITRGNLNASINNMYNNLNNNIAPADNNTLEERLASIPYFNKKYANKNALYHIGDNLMASAQGAISGLSYSNSPWGALIGGILGGAFNIASSVDEPFRLRKYNNAVDRYNLAQRSITDQLLDNSKLGQMNDYNARYAKLGGPLNTHGGNFQNGLFEVVNGGTHEQNPYEGVPMGMDDKGNPNLVEEGEYIWNDNYVFSKRMQVPEDVRKKYKLGGEMSYADAVDKVQKESEERPNDPISKRGLNAILTELAMSQEIERQKQQQQEAYEEAENIASMFADGGSIHINKNKRGTFTAAATKHNMGVQEFAGHVLANKDKYSSAMVKKANFARNASKWHHALGGKLFDDGGPKKNHQYTFNDIEPIFNSAIDIMDFVPWYMKKQVKPDISKEDRNLLSQPSEFENFEEEPSPAPEPYFPYNGKKTPFARANMRENYETTPKPPFYVDNSIYSDPLINEVIGKRNSRINPKDITIEPEGYYNTETKALDVNAALRDQSKEALKDLEGYNEKLRYAPIAGAIGALLNDLKPLDYSNAEQIENAARNINRFRGYRPLSNYMGYRPENPAQYTNELRSGYAAQLRALNDLSNGNPAQREAVAAAMQRQYGDTIGNMLMKVADYNAKNRMAVEQANNAINQYNSKMAADMAQINQRGEQMYLSGITQGAAMRNALEAAQSAAVSSDYNSLFDSLGLVGKENASRNMINEMGMPFFYQDENGKTHIVYRNTAKCGGKLFKVKK